MRFNISCASVARAEHSLLSHFFFDHRPRFGQRHVRPLLLRITRIALIAVIAVVGATSASLAVAQASQPEPLTPAQWSDDPTIVDPELMSAIKAFIAASRAEADEPPPPAADPGVDLSMLSGGSTLKSAPLQSFFIDARELVDVEFAPDGALSILVSAPGTAAPGLYRWPVGSAALTKLCDIAAPSFFSFDRKVVIERVRGTPSRVRVFSPHDCRLITDVEVEGRALDVDADLRGQHIAVATRLSEKQIALQLYDLRGTQLATAPIGRNVEMGFSPDGRMIVNFDLSDAGARAWSVPKLADVTLPRWLSAAEATFVPGSNFVKRYDAGKLSITRWPMGTTLHSIKTSRSLRLRQLSHDGSIGIVHEYLRGADRLDWINFATGQRSALAAGSIDNAALSPDLQWAAWTLRKGATRQVWVQRARTPVPAH